MRLSWLCSPSRSRPGLGRGRARTLGVAQRGSLKAVSGVLLSLNGGEMKGVWLDATQNCRARRTLRVSIEIDLVSPAGKTTRIRRQRSGGVDNCSEGGPQLRLRPRTEGVRDGPRERPLALRPLLADDEDDGHSLRPQRRSQLYRQVTRRC